MLPADWFSERIGVFAGKYQTCPLACQRTYSQTATSYPLLLQIFREVHQNVRRIVKIRRMSYHPNLSPLLSQTRPLLVQIGSD
jgi:hypothetical protein